MQNLFIAVALWGLCLSCSKDAGREPPADLPATSFLNAQYGSHPEQAMDVYLPAGRTDRTPALVIVHGGGWSAGDKSDFDNFITAFRKRLPEFALINLNYRLVKSNDHFFPAQENDLRAAMQFLKDRAGDYAISTDLVIVGISAGAHLAMLQGYKHADILRPMGIVSFFGPVDLLRLYANSDSSVPWVLRRITNATPDTNPAIFEQSSPLRYITPDAPPTLILHGDADEIVPLEQSEMLRKKLAESGVAHELVVYPGLGHGWIGEPLDDSFTRVAQFARGLTN